MVFVLLTVITVFIMLFLTHVDELETALSYLHFSEEMKEGRYKISNEDDYLEFAKTVASGNTYEYCEVVLVSDLNFEGYAEVPVIGLNETETVSFKGIFNGNGHSIRGMQMTDSKDVSGMFACLDGIVSNLHLENCVFSGTISGGIAAYATEKSVILNCHVDVLTTGEVTGTIVGELSGNILNSVSGEQMIGNQLETARLENCYLQAAGEYLSFTEELGVLDAGTVGDRLNANLPRVSGCSGVYDLCTWDRESDLHLSGEKAELLKELAATFYIKQNKVSLNGYYSEKDNCWCIALPAGYQAEDVIMTATTNYGNAESFKRKETEAQVLFTKDNYQYLIDYFCADNIDTLYIELNNHKNLAYVHKNKKEEIPGILTVFEKNGTVNKAVVKGFYGHGNDSWTFEKKSYNLKLEDRIDLLGIGANEEYALLAGYRKNSLMSFCTTTEMVQELGFAYAPDFRLVNVFVEGEYAGVYYLVEKIEIDESSLNITNLYEETKKQNHGNLKSYEFCEWKDENTAAERYWYNIPNIPTDITGGYILEADSTDYTDFQSRFVSERNIHLTLKRFNYASKEEVDYIADYWQEFEDALFSVDGYNDRGKYYTEYIDLESFATQWLLYELAEEASLGSSIYFYKESEKYGDGLLHACYPWDMEQSYIQERQDVLWNVKVKGKAMYGYWGVCYTHEDFRQEVRRVWNEKLVPIVEFMIQEGAAESNSGLKNINYYINELETINRLERSRWNDVNPIGKCIEINTFLAARLNTLNELLFEEAFLQEYFEKFQQLF